MGLTSDDDEEYYSDHLVQTLSSQLQPNGVEVSESNSSDPDSNVEREVFVDCHDSNDSNDSNDTSSECKCGTHEGKLIMDSTFPVTVDRAFELIFTDNKFIHNLHKSRRTYDLCVSQWQDSDKDKKRQLTYTVALNHPLVKSARTIERQYLLEKSTAGQLYIIKSEADTEGVPYCDTFSTNSLWCLTKESEDMTRIKVHSKLIFKKNVWGLALMKPMIEKSSIQGITDFCNDLSKQLPNWLQFERNLGVVPNLEAIDDLSLGLKTSDQLVTDSYDSIPVDSLSAIHLKGIPLIPKPNQRLHPIVKILNSMSDTFLMKIILVLLLFTLLLNFLIMTRIWRIETQTVYSSPSVSEESPTAIDSNNVQKIIETSIEMIKNIESNLQKLRNRFRDEL